MILNCPDTPPTKTFLKNKAEIFIHTNDVLRDIYILKALTYLIPRIQTNGLSKDNFRYLSGGLPAPGLCTQSVPKINPACPSAPATVLPMLPKYKYEWLRESQQTCSRLSNCRLKYETEQLKAWGSKGMKALDWHKVQRSNVKAKMKTHLPHLYCGKHFPIKHSLMLYNFWCNISLLPRYSLYMGNIKVKNVIFNVPLQPCDI